MGDQIEEEMLATYVMERFKGRIVSPHLRLGQPRGFTRERPAPEELRRLHMSELPEADLVYRDGNHAFIYEFAIWKPSMKLGQLLIYKTLLPSTPSFYDIDPTNISLVLVNGQNDNQIREAAAAYNVAYEVFLPPNVAAKVAARRGGSYMYEKYVDPSLSGKI